MSVDPHQHIQQKQLHPLPKSINGAIITVSDRCAAGESIDKSGPLAKELLAEHGVNIVKTICVPDGLESVTTALNEMLDLAREDSNLKLIFTTGGTGITMRDLTPDATAPFLICKLEGIMQQILLQGLKNTPLAGLSRGLIGISSRGSTGVIIANAPGSRGGVKDTVAVLGPLIPHILEQLDPQEYAYQPNPSGKL